MATQERRYQDGRNYARRQLEIDPLRELAFRQLLENLARDGQRDAALAQYERWKKRLAEDLGVAPDQETAALRRLIQEDRLRDPV